MATLKERLYAICAELAEEFEGWKFTAGGFKNSDLKHTSLVVSPGFAFRQVSAILQPSIHVCNKHSMRLFKKIIEREHPTSLVRYSSIEGFKGFFRDSWKSSSIIKSRQEWFQLSPFAKKQEESYIEFSEAKDVLRAMVRDGIAMLHRYYDLSSEAALLRGLPPRYEPHYVWDTPAGMSGSNGTIACIAHILVGDFDFFERYLSDKYKTGGPKDVADLEKIAAALPDLRKRYEETGKVI